MMSFKKQHSLEKRKMEGERIRAKYPDRIPVICEMDPSSKDIGKLDKNKFLVPGDLTIGQFIYVIRKKIKLNSEKALFMYIGNVLPPTSALIKDIYKANKDDDSFIYFSISGEHVFGTHKGTFAFQ